MLGSQSPRHYPEVLSKYTQAGYRDASRLHQDSSLVKSVGHLRIWLPLDCTTLIIMLPLVLESLCVAKTGLTQFSEGKHRVLFTHASSQTQKCDCLDYLRLGDLDFL